MATRRPFDQEAWARMQEEHARKLHEARLLDLATVDRKIDLAEQRIRAAQIDLADLRNTRQEIINDIAAAEQRATDGGRQDEAAGPAATGEG